MFSIYDFILVLPAMLLAIYAQFKVKSSFKKYSKVLAASGVTGVQVARRLLDIKGLNHVPIELSPGSLSDHYDPRGRVLRLSPEVYHGYSVAALGVAAHEVGHAIQHDEKYVPLDIRHKLVPVASFGSMAAFPLILLGFFLNSSTFLFYGIIAFSLAVAFQLITLPVEFNASRRAMTLLVDKGYIAPQEVGGTKKVLNAAALTYVAATLVAVAELIKYILIFRGQSNDD
ncbi:MAG: zinc metallopeptidase [Thermincolia bacterium]